jgi:hypothetical protein
MNVLGHCSSACFILVPARSEKVASFAILTWGEEWFAFLTEHGAEGCTNNDFMWSGTRSNRGGGLHLSISYFNGNITLLWFNSYT